MQRKIILSLLALLSAAAPSQGGILPAWWSDAETQIIDSGAAESNYAPASIGQLKHAALQAKKYLDRKAPGGSGGIISAMVGNFQPRAGVTYSASELEAIRKANLAPATIGQLKAVAKPFYDRLMAASFPTRVSLIAHGYPASWEFVYPWDPSTAPIENYRPANLGQLKLVFSFDFFDADADNLPDEWEKAVTGGQGDWYSVLDGDGVHDADGDGFSDLVEFSIGWSPITDNLNLASDAESFAYDAAGRLVAVTGRNVLRYFSDAAGNLVETLGY